MKPRNDGPATAEPSPENNGSFGRLRLARPAVFARAGSLLLLALAAGGRPARAQAPPANPPPEQVWRGEDLVRVRLNQARLAKWRVARVKFEEATLEDAVEFLRGQAKAAAGEGPGLNFVIGPGAREAAADKTVTLALAEVPLGAVLKYATEALGLEYRVEPAAIVIAKPPAR